jgi:hypothetical protein
VARYRETDSGPIPTLSVILSDPELVEGESKDPQLFGQSRARDGFFDFAQNDTRRGFFDFAQNDVMPG